MARKITKAVGRDFVQSQEVKAATLIAASNLLLARAIRAGKSQIESEQAEAKACVRMAAFLALEMEAMTKRYHRESPNPSAD